MSPKRGSSRVGGCVALVIILAILAAGVWFGVPILAEKEFGEPAPYLDGFNRWNFSLQVLSNKNDLNSAANPQADELSFEIEPGESVTSVAGRLQDAGLIRDASGLRAYLVYKGFDAQVIAGKYTLSPAMSSLEIARKIQTTYSQDVPFYIYPGWRAEEIAAALPTSGIQVDPDRFLQLVHNPNMMEIGNPYAGFPSLDGFLYPGSYVIDREVSAEELISIFLGEFERQVSADLITGIEVQGLTLYEGVTLASIIQRETFKDDERARMASVFYNRLRTGMKLETDPTVQYALGYSDRWGWWKTPLASADLEVDSVYNTYQYFGLPPTPISNPDLTSLQAVANPEETEYFYFRATCDNSGYHDFSQTFEEHLSKSCD